MRHLLFTLTLSAFTASFAASESRQACARNVALVVDAHDHLRVGGVGATGEWRYPLELVLRNLQLSRAELAKYKQKNVLLVAEGFGAMLPYLVRKRFSRVEAVDPAYHLEDYPSNSDGKLLAAFVRRYERFLVQGSVFELPYLSDSQDLVLCHLLMNNLSAQEVSATREMLRVLKPGGVAHIYGYPSTPAVLINLLRGAGYTVTEWRTRQSMATETDSAYDIKLSGLKITKPTN